jgi:hypothetical protein
MYLSLGDVICVVGSTVFVAMTIDKVAPLCWMLWLWLIFMTAQGADHLLTQGNIGAMLIAEYLYSTIR